MNTCNLFTDVLYIIAPANTPDKLPLCVVVTCGGNINLSVALLDGLPASLISTAPTTTVEPTPRPPTTTPHSCAFILTFANSLVVLIPIEPLFVTNTCGESSKVASSSSFTTKMCDVDSVPIATLFVAKSSVVVVTPATVLLLRVDTPTAAFALPASVPETLPVNVP